MVVPSVTEFADEPRLLPTFTTTPPLLIATGPEKVLLPERVSVLDPPTLRPALPATGAVIVALALTLMLAAPVIVSVSAPLAEMV